MEQGRSSGGSAGFDSAYALDFLARAGPAAGAAFVAWAEPRVAAQPEPFRRRFAPVVRGLRWAAEGGEFDGEGLARGASVEARRLRGWTVGRHWLPGDAAAR